MIEKINDSWRDAILAERQLNHVHTVMHEGLAHLHGERNRALILGDASLVQAKHLSEVEHFPEVVVVDASPTLMDAGAGIDDNKITRVMSNFDRYDLPQSSFDFIYGKSIGFNPKRTVPPLLKKIHAGLRDEGVFVAVWAGHQDTYRPVHYTDDEVRILYARAQLEIIYLEIGEPVQNSGLITAGTTHSITVFARRIRTTDGSLTSN